MFIASITLTIATANRETFPQSPKSHFKPCLHFRQILLSFCIRVRSTCLKEITHLQGFPPVFAA